MRTLDPSRPYHRAPPGRSKASHERLVAMIHAEEQALVEHLQTITRDLERQIKFRKRRQQWYDRAMDHDELTNKRVHAIARAHDCTNDEVPWQASAV